MSNETSILIINRDSFLEPLGLQQLAREITSPKQQDLLYRITIEYLSERGLLESEPPSGTSPNELPLKIPGLPFDGSSVLAYKGRTRWPSRRRIADLRSGRSSR